MPLIQMYIHFYIKTFISPFGVKQTRHWWQQTDSWPSTITVFWQNKAVQLLQHSPEPNLEAESSSEMLEWKYLAGCSNPKDHNLIEHNVYSSNPHTTNKWKRHVLWENFLLFPKNFTTWIQTLHRICCNACRTTDSICNIWCTTLWCHKWECKCISMYQLE